MHPLISIQSGMLVTLGFLMASLLALLLASAFWSRAVRLTTRRLKDSLPVSEPEIKADLDRLRAAYAIKVHKLDTQLEQAKLERARHLIDINRRDASISALETDVVAIKAELDENANARRVLEQTVADRLPKVEARLAEAKRLLFNRDREIAELAQGAKRHKAALEEATSINVQRSAEIERLNTALITRGGRKRRSGGGEDEPEGEVALRAEAEALRTKTREQAALIDRLQRRLGEGYLITAAVTGTSTQTVALAPGENPVQSQVERLRESIADAEQALQAARSGASTEPARVERDRERELRALKARAEDQAGEIARLKAALGAFEQADETAPGLRNSRLALKARAGSAEAHAERQAATIAKLRAELAAVNERLAQQAAHFMEEMRRIGSGTAPASGQARRAGRNGQRRRLAERVAQIAGTPPTSAPPPASAPPPSASQEERADDTAKAAGNGKAADPVPQATPPSTAKVEPQAQPGSQSGLQSGLQSGPQTGPPTRPQPEPATAAAAPSPPAAPAAAEMPQTAAIPEQGRKMRLLDRITGVGKN
jgi:hypothetical protein